MNISHLTKHKTLSKSAFWIPAALLGGLLSGISLSVSWLWPLAFIGPMPLFILIYTKKLTNLISFLYGWLFGFVLISICIEWMFNTIPLEWAGIKSGPESIAIVTLVWLVISAVLGLFIGLWVLVIRRIVVYGLLDTLIIPLSWVIFEILRMFGFNILNWGPGSLLAPSFSFGALGYALAQNGTLVGIARIMGVYSLSFSVLFLSFLAWNLLFRYIVISKKQSMALASLSLTGLIVLIIFPVRLPKSGLNVATMSTDYPSRLKYTYADRKPRAEDMMRKIAKIAKANPNTNVILLPEGANFIHTISYYQHNPLDYLQSLFGSHEVLLIDNENISAANASSEETVYFSSFNGEIGRAKKQILTPFGEYLPDLMKWTMDAVGKQSQVADIEAYRTLLPGDSVRTITYHNVPLVALTCYEVLSPQLYHSLASDQKGVVLMNNSSQTIFNHGANPFHQLEAMAKVHAVWVNAPYYQSTNGNADIRLE